MGALAYGTEMVLLSIGGGERWRTMPWTVLALGVVILSGAIVGVLLMRAFLVDAWRTFCLASAATSFAIFGFGYDEPLAGLRHLRGCVTRGAYLDLAVRLGDTLDLGARPDLAPSSSTTTARASATSA